MEDLPNTRILLKELFFKSFFLTSSFKKKDLCRTKEPTKLNESFEYFHQKYELGKRFSLR